ncbi:unnamed protein product [Arctia plantaginis]|uniref:Uncharacterized protein n=1 Tax=Arctia plantaginis TaxID=874455 RepID=A0A8S1BCG4_ARCPL|nr:unnamed protein product [Arctia plantaginis]
MSGRAPYLWRSAHVSKLERLGAGGTIYRFEDSEYGTPIVPVINTNGDIRMCGDYKVTRQVNRKLRREFYPLPRIEEVFATLSVGKEFSKIDLTHAYLQTVLDEYRYNYAYRNIRISWYAVWFVLQKNLKE